MNLTKQKDTLEVKNIDSLFELESKQKKNIHGSLFPDNLQILAIGKTSSGKTSAIVNLLLHENGLSYENLYIFCPTLQQNKYKLLDKVFSEIKEIGFHTFTSTDTNIDDLKQLKRNSICIFDDYVLEGQNLARKLFSTGRHYGVLCTIFLSQTYTAVHKQLLRDNCNFLIVFKQDRRNLEAIFNEHVIGDLTFQKFCKICFDIWKTKYNFLVISKEDPINNGRYRKNFDNYITNINED